MQKDETQIIRMAGSTYLIEGDTYQGAIDSETGASVSPFVDAAVAAIQELAPDARVLLYGGGTYTIPRDARADVRMDVIEINPEMEVLAERYFGWVPRETVQTTLMDAEMHQPEQSYDLIIVDIFDGHGAPEFVRQAYFYDGLAGFAPHVIVNEHAGPDLANQYEYGEAWDSVLTTTLSDEDGWFMTDLSRESYSSPPRL